MSLGLRGKTQPAREQYKPKGSVLKDEAEQILNAVREKPNGVSRWIMKYWFRGSSFCTQKFEP